VGHVDARTIAPTFRRDGAQPAAGPGVYRGRQGFEIRPLRQTLEIEPDTHEIVVEVEKVLPWRERGWVTADTHVHFLSPRRRSWKARPRA